MEKRSIEAIVRALNEARARYLIAGGVAVVAHGYTRFTQDLDIILDLSPDNLHRALPALAALGYRPTVPVPLEQFADAAIREQWSREKQLTVLSLFSDAHPTVVIDLFVQVPVDFDRAYERAARLEVAPSVQATVVGYDDLVGMKAAAGRPKDLADLEKLRVARGEDKHG